MADLTTAQRLSAYHDELLAAKFTEDVVEEFLKAIAPHHIESLIVKDDLPAEPEVEADRKIDVVYRLMPISRDLADQLDRKDAFGRIEGR